MAKIQILNNGPLFVQGDDVELVDAAGQPVEPPKYPFALCRCGASSKKPFCDGSHTPLGFDGTLASATTPSAS